MFEAAGVVTDLLGVAAPEVTGALEMPGAVQVVVRQLNGGLPSLFCSRRFKEGGSPNRLPLLPYHRDGACGQQIGNSHLSHSISVRQGP